MSFKFVCKLGSLIFKIIIKIVAHHFLFIYTCKTSIATELVICLLVSLAKETILVNVHIVKMEKNIHLALNTYLV